MSSSAFASVSTSVYSLATDLYKKFSKLSQDQLDSWVKTAKIEFPVVAGARAAPDFDVVGFDNSKLKTPKVNDFKRAKNGQVLALKYEKNLATADGTDYENIVIKQSIVQALVFNLRAEFYKAPEKDSNGKKIKGTESKNITPYGVACQEMFLLLEIESTWKLTYAEKEHEGELRTVLIRPEQTEEQKESLRKGQKSKARAGVSKGKSQKQKQLESVLHSTQEELMNLKGYLIYLHDHGKLLLDADEEKVYDNIVKQNCDNDDDNYRVFELKCGMPNGDVSIALDSSYEPTRTKTKSTEGKSRENTPIISDEFLGDTDDEEMPFCDTAGCRHRQPCPAPQCQPIKREVSNGSAEIDEEELIAMMEADEEREAIEAQEQADLEDAMNNMTVGPPVAPKPPKSVIDALMSDDSGSEDEDREAIEMENYKKYIAKYTMVEDEFPDFICFNKVSKDEWKESGLWATLSKQEKRDKTTDLLAPWIEMMEEWLKMDICEYEDDWMLEYVINPGKTILEKRLDGSAFKK